MISIHRIKGNRKMSKAFTEAFVGLREAGCTNVLVFGTQVGKKGTELLWDFSGADGGDTLALLGMIRFLEDEIAWIVDGEEEETEDAETSD